MDTQKRQIATKRYICLPVRTAATSRTMTGSAQWICIAWESTISMIAKYLIQLRQSKLCRKECCQPPYDVTPLETAMPLGVKGRRSYPLLRLGSYKPMAFWPWVVDTLAYTQIRKVCSLRSWWTDHPRSFGVPNAPCFIKKRKTLHRKAFRKSAACALVKNPKHGRC